MYMRSLQTALIGLCVLHWQTCWTQPTTIYVSPLGQDFDSCGLTVNASCLTVDKAIDTAFNFTDADIIIRIDQGSVQMCGSFYPTQLNSLQLIGASNGQSIVTCSNVLQTPAFQAVGYTTGSLTVDRLTFQNYQFDASFSDVPIALAVFLFFPLAPTTFTITSTSFLNNYSGKQVRAGASVVYCNALVTVFNCTFSGNVAQRGAAISHTCFLSDDDNTGIPDEVFVISEERSSISNSVFYNNTVYGDISVGGAIVFEIFSYLLNRSFSDSRSYILNSSFTLNSASSGGAIAWVGLSITPDPSIHRWNVTDCLFDSNSASFDGGATVVTTQWQLFGHDDTPLTQKSTIYLVIRATLYTYNSAERYGGSSFASFGHLHLTSVNFTNCQAISTLTNYGYGGCIFSQSGILNLTSCLFTDCAASSSGGCILLRSSLIANITSTSFTMTTNNTLTRAGGAISIEGATAVITGCTFTNISSTLNGGAIRIGSSFDSLTSFVQIVQSIFQSNSASSGAGIYTFAYSIVSVTNSYFIQNSAHSSGGAISSNDRTYLSLLACIFQNNSGIKSAQGGGLFFAGSSLYLASGNFSGNFADSGGAIYFGNSTYSPAFSSLQIVTTNFTGNSANLGGAVFYSSLSTLAFTSGTFFDSNLANSSLRTDSAGCGGSGFGGAIFFQTNPCSLVSMDSTVQFVSNSASNAGGAIYSQLYLSSVGQCLISYYNLSYFSGNSAGAWGNDLASDFSQFSLSGQYVYSSDMILLEEGVNSFSPGRVLGFSVQLLDSLGNLIPSSVSPVLLSVVLDPKINSSSGLIVFNTGSGLLARLLLQYRLIVGWNSNSINTAITTNLQIQSDPSRNVVSIPIEVQPCEIGFNAQPLDVGNNVQLYECQPVDGFLFFNSSIQIFVICTCVGLYLIVLLCFKLSYDALKDSTVELKVRNGNGLLESLTLPNPHADPYGHRIMFFSSFGGFMIASAILMSLWTSSNGYCHLHQLVLRAGNFFILVPFILKM